jgi:hypothetical protein
MGSTQRRWLHHSTDLRGVRVRALGRSPLQGDRHCATTPGHADWFDMSFVYWGFITHETVESAPLRVLTDFCDHNPTVVALSPFGLFPVVSPHDPAWLDRMDHLRELLLLAEPLDVTQMLARCLNVVFTLQGPRYNTAVIIGQRLEAARRNWQQLPAAH